MRICPEASWESWMEVSPLSTAPTLERGQVQSRFQICQQAVKLFHGRRGAGRPSDALGEKGAEQIEATCTMLVLMGLTLGAGGTGRQSGRGRAGTLTFAREHCANRDTDL